MPPLTRSRAGFPPKANQAKVFGGIAMRKIVLSAATLFFGLSGLFLVTGTAAADEDWNRVALVANDEDWNSVNALECDEDWNEVCP
jgi:hypothetical protein